MNPIDFVIIIVGTLLFRGLVEIWLRKKPGHTWPSGFSWKCPACEHFVFRSNQAWLVDEMQKKHVKDFHTK